jgi:predicted nucleotidyltransferase
MQLSPIHQMFVDRFVTACRTDDRVIAAFLGGSYAKGAADEFSDLDVYVITTDEAYDDFMAGRAAFLGRLGEPVFLENFDPLNLTLFIYADGVEGELGVGRAGAFTHIHGGPYRALLDKQDILAGVVFPSYQPDRTEQIEKLRQQLVWFWHDLSHFLAAHGRGQQWSAYGQLEALRRCCINLARLREDVLDAAEGDETYFKVEQALPVATLSALEASLSSLDRGALLQAARVLVGFYRTLAPGLAREHGLVYPAELERLLLERLETQSR